MVEKEEEEDTIINNDNNRSSLQRRALTLELISDKLALNAKTHNSHTL